ERTARAQEAFRAAVADRPKDEVERFIERHYPDYWLRTETRKAVEHFTMVRSAEAAGARFASHFRPAPSPPIPNPPCLAPNTPRLLGLLAGACAAAGANISGAHISTTRDGFALDTFLLARAFELDDDEGRRARRIAETIEKVLKGEIRLAHLMAKSRTRRG